MSVLRPSRQKTVLVIAAVAAVLVLAFAWLAHSGVWYLGELGLRAGIFFAALGIAAVLIVGLQELTDRIEHH